MADLLSDVDILQITEKEKWADQFLTEEELHDKYFKDNITLDTGYYENNNQVYRQT